MPYDENEDTNHPRPAPPETAPALTAALAGTLCGAPDDALLARQAAILNGLFEALVAQKVDLNSFHSSTTQNWLLFALRVQKQCTDTLKARAAITYMDTLVRPSPRPPPQT
jgi:hypothetical protein